ncbi:MAG: DNA repair protein [Pseudomonadota bacterium]
MTDIAPTTLLSNATVVLQKLCTLLLAVLALGLAIDSAAAALGFVPWLELPVSIGGQTVQDAGMWAQLGVTALLLTLLGFLPSNARVRKLEVTNRNFQISMDDVARAYEYVHRADREGVFQTSREFDAMRERIEWMRKHPDLVSMEHDVLQLAAQMSVESRDLAEIYADEKVARAQNFLRQRQQEVEDYRQRIAMAQATVQEMKRWMQSVSVEEGLAEKQLERLQSDLADVTESMRLSGHGQRAKNVVGMPRREKAIAPLATPAE